MNKTTVPAVVSLMMCSVGCSRDTSNSLRFQEIESLTQSVFPIIAREKENLRVQEDDAHLAVVATAFVIHSDGLLATASHIRNFDDVFTIWGNEFQSCNILETELGFKYLSDRGMATKNFDIAVLEIPTIAGKVKPLSLSSVVEPRVGSQVLMIGYYGGGHRYQIDDVLAVQPLLTVGVVSSSFLIYSGSRPIGSRLALDITGGPGASGSPILDAESREVLGITTDAMLAEFSAPFPNESTSIEHRVPMGIVYADTVVPLRKWLEDHPL